MLMLLKILAWIAAILVGFFILTFTVYFFNLDMKMMAAIQPWLLKLYDRRKRAKISQAPPRKARLP